MHSKTREREPVAGTEVCMVKDLYVVAYEMQAAARKDLLYQFKPKCQPFRFRFIILHPLPAKYIARQGCPCGIVV